MGRAERHVPASFNPREWTPGTHWIGVWVGLRAVLDTKVRRKTIRVCQDLTPVVQSVVIVYIKMPIAGCLDFV
jgi:hypothetical protein